MSSTIYFFIHWAEVIPSSAWRVCTSGRPSRLRGRFVSQTATSVFVGGHECVLYVRPAWAPARNSGPSFTRSSFWHTLPSRAGSPELPV